MPVTYDSVAAGQRRFGIRLVECWIPADGARSIYLEHIPYSKLAMAVMTSPYDKVSPMSKMRRAP